MFRSFIVLMWLMTHGQSAVTLQMRGDKDQQLYNQQETFLPLTIKETCFLSEQKLG